MTKYIALLRGINVGGKRKVLMADLKVLFARLGFSNITTYIQSGNVIFESQKVEDNMLLGQSIQNAILETYQFEVPVMIRSLNEWEQAISDNPFFKDKSIAIERLYLTLLDERAGDEQIASLKKMDFGSDQFEIIGKHVFICFAGKYSDSKLTNGLFEKKLKRKATTRNWKTVLKLSELSQ